jgi:hypothetical protein
MVEKSVCRYKIIILTKWNINTCESTYYVKMEKTLEYYFDDGTHVLFDRYTINTCGIIVNKKTNRQVSPFDNGKYNRYSVRDNTGKQRNILSSRAVASTFISPPPNREYSVDHIDRNPTNDVLENIRWLCRSGQSNNQARPDSCKSAFVIVKDGVEKTVKEWVDSLKYEKNPFGRGYTSVMIGKYAGKKQYGFSYKEYPDLEEEVWKEIVGSENKNGRWEISNMNRIKYITTFAENTLVGDRLCLSANGYPRVRINGRIWYCHVLSFMTFFPEKYAAKKYNEMILHEDDNKKDFRPHKLRIGTSAENCLDSHANGKRDGTKTARMRCASYIGDVFEKEYDSQSDAERYLKTIGIKEASNKRICEALCGNRNIVYGRVWTRIC